MQTAGIGSFEQYKDVKDRMDCVTMTYELHWPLKTAKSIKVVWIDEKTEENVEVRIT